jgi:hypothetical protein
MSATRRPSVPTPGRRSGAVVAVSTLRPSDQRAKDEESAAAKRPRPIFPSSPSRARAVRAPRECPLDRSRKVSIRGPSNPKGCQDSRAEDPRPDVATGAATVASVVTVELLACWEWASTATRARVESMSGAR